MERATGSSRPGHDRALCAGPGSASRSDAGGRAAGLTSPAPKGRMMAPPIWLVGTVLALQVPPPPSASPPSKALRAEYRAILAREGAELGALAGRLKGRG